MAVVVACSLQVLTAAPVEGAPNHSSGGLWSPPDTPNPATALVPVKPVPTHARPTGITVPSPYHPRPVVLPGASTVSVTLAAVPGAAAAGAASRPGSVGIDPADLMPVPRTVQVAESPVYLTGAPSAPAATNVSVRFFGTAAAQKAGVVSGLVWGLSGQNTATVRVGLDPSALEGISGGNFAQRLTLVELPACAANTPQVAACQRQTSVPFTRDPVTGRLEATVTVPATGMVVMAAGAAPDGSAGTFSATSTKPSNEWSQGGATGGFDYTYPITLPPTMGGQPPTVALSYGSQDVDGLTAATNAQTSWVGSGWNYEPGYIERSYMPCSDDGIANSADTCWGWGGDEVSLNQSGMGGQIVNDDGTGHAWRLAGTPGATVQLLRNTSTTNNGAYKGEYWVITTQDGTRYYYGAGHLPTAEGGTGVDPASNSAWTEPIYCPKSGDPCFSTSTGTSSFATNMAYRWNLDYVVDPHGNTTVYTYQPETNYYARSSAHTLTSYTRGGVLKQISYGWRSGDAAAASPKPAAEVVFTTAQRCTGSPTECSSLTNLTSTTKADWPDTPFDLICKSSGTCTNLGESFFSTLKLTQIQTLINKAGTYHAVDTYALNQSFPDPGDGTSPSLWLDSIVRTGNDGTAVSMPAVTFGPVQLPNRVPGSGTYPAFNHLRLADIVDETGGEIAVTYTNTTATVAACDQTPGSSSLPTPSSDDRLCYQQYWTGPGQQNPTADWFEKYIVSQVQVKDLVAGSPDQVSTYVYNGAPAWHRDDSPMTKNAQRSWNQFRGFGSVTTLTGAAPDPITQTTVTYLRGMNGDYESQTGGTQRSVTVSDTIGDPPVTDSNQYADTSLETDTYSASGGAVEQKSVTLPWSAQIASHAETTQTGLPAEKAYFSAAGTTVTAAKLTSGSWRTTKAVNTYSATTGLLQQVDDQGDMSLVGTAASQETCETMTYATPPTSGLNTGLVNLTGRDVKVSVNTAGPIGTGACPAATSTNTLTDRLDYYDGQPTYGVVGSVGNTTAVGVVDHFSGGTPVYVNTTSAATFDVYGRSTGATDSRGLVSTSAFTPATGQLPTSITTTDVTFGFATTKTMDQARQLPTKSVDENNNATSEAYDALGRLTSVWKPGRTVAQTASIRYVYRVNGSAAPSTVETDTLRDDGTYAEDVTIQNGQGQVRQDQTVSLDGRNGSLVTDTFYDSHGWVIKNTTPYAIAAGPSTNMVATADSAVPQEQLTTYDGRGRTLSVTVESFANPQWSTLTAYPGAERTDVTPPSGGTAMSKFTDARGRASAVWRYTTATPTGNAADARIIANTYQPNGLLDTVTGPGGQQWSYGYNLHGDTTRSVDPDTGTTTSTFDPAGDLLTSTDSNGQLLTYTYDKLGRKTAEYAGAVAPANELASWAYDSVPGGRAQPASSTTYVGGASGVAYVESITGYSNGYRQTGSSLTIPTNAPGSLAGLKGTYTTSTSYNPISSSVSSVSYNADGGLPAETVFYTYNQVGTLTNLGSAGTTYLAGTTSDPFGRITRWTMGVMPYQVVQTNVYDDATGRVTEQTIDKETGLTHVDDVTALYDPSGHVTAANDIQDGSSTDLQCYSYDQLGQLTAAWSDTAGVTTAASPSVPGIGHCTTTTPSAATVGGPAPYWQTYAYNTSANRSTETDHDPSGVVANDVTRTYGYNGVGAQPDELQSQAHTGPGAGTDTYTYDTAGQTKTRTVAGGPNQTISYTADHRTAAVSDTSGNSAAYTYAADGTLLLESDTRAGATTVTLYFGAEQLVLATGTGQVTGQRYYETAGGPTVVRSSTGSLTYECGNDQHTSTLVIDAGAAQTETRRYFTPFGAARGPVPGSWVDNHAFVGQPADPATGLDLLGVRNYDPAVGRFLQRDPVFEGGDIEQIGGYGYGGNDPVDHADASGRFFLGPCIDVCGGGGAGSGPAGGGTPSPAPGPPPPGSGNGNGNSGGYPVPHPSPGPPPPDLYQPTCHGVWIAGGCYLKQSVRQQNIDDHADWLALNYAALKGGDCESSSVQIVCTGVAGPGVTDRAMTVGDVLFYPGSKDDLIRQLSNEDATRRTMETSSCDAHNTCLRVSVFGPDLLGHEAGHSAQYASLGFGGFLENYALASLASHDVCGAADTCNIDEIGANTYKGGYWNPPIPNQTSGGFTPDPSNNKTANLIAPVYFPLDSHNTCQGPCNESLDNYPIYPEPDPLW